MMKSMTIKRWAEANKLDQYTTDELHAMLFEMSLALRYVGVGTNMGPAHFQHHMYPYWEDFNEFMFELRRENPELDADALYQLTGLYWGVENDLKKFYEGLDHTPADHWSVLDEDESPILRKLRAKAAQNNDA